MNYPLDNIVDFPDLEESVHKVLMKEEGESWLGTFVRDPILFAWLLPFAILGIISNVLVLWIWMSVKTKFDSTVYLFRALALADLLYVFTYACIRFYVFHNLHIKMFFSLLCFSHRTISLHITLMLAIVRFIKLYYPLHVQKMLSRSRLRLGIMIIVFCNLALAATWGYRELYMPEKDAQWNLLAFRRVISLIIPVVAQNLLMLMLVFKLKRFSKTVAPSCNAQVLQLPEQGQTMSDQENQELAHKSVNTFAVQTGHLLALEHRETACDAGTQDPLTPVDTEETAQSEQTAGQLKTKHRSVDCKAELDTIQEEDSITKTEPQSVKQRQSMQGLESGPCEDRTIALQPKSASSKGMTDFDSGIIYVVLAICASTFVSQLLCAILRSIYTSTNIFKTPYLSYACSVAIIINHSINLVFYLFISSFRQFLLSKCGRLADTVRSFSSISLKATYPAMGSGGIALDSNSDAQFLTTSGQKPSPTKYVACSTKNMSSGLRQ